MVADCYGAGGQCEDLVEGRGHDVLLDWLVAKVPKIEKLRPMREA